MQSTASLEMAWMFRLVVGPDLEYKYTIFSPSGWKPSFGTAGSENREFVVFIPAITNYSTDDARLSNTATLALLSHRRRRAYRRLHLPSRSPTRQTSRRMLPSHAIRDARHGRHQPSRLWLCHPRHANHDQAGPRRYVRASGRLRQQGKQRQSLQTTSPFRQRQLHDRRDHGPI